MQELAPMASKKVAVVIGRMNPPTSGHYLIIDAAKKFIRKHSDLGLEAAPVVVIIGGSNTDSDKKKNPLSIEDRAKFMKASGKVNGCSFFHAKDAFKAFSMLRSKGLEPIVVAAGSDRATEYKGILDQYFKTTDDKPIKHYLINVSRNDDKSDSSIKSDDIKNVSGSVARRAVELGYEPEFAKIVGLEDKPTLAKKMFDKIKASLKESKDKSMDAANND